MIDRRILTNIDFFLICILLLIISIGLLTVYSASFSLGLGGYYFYRQLIWVFIGLFVMIVIALIDFRLLTKLGLPLHLIVIGLLILTLFFGVGSSYSNVERWLDIGPINIQVSEFAKFTIILTIAHFFRESRKFAKFNYLSLIWLTVLIAIPFFLILRQPDLGTAMLFIITALVMIFFCGLKYRVILIGLTLLIIITPLVWEYGLADYQKDRILTIFNPEKDLLGSGYHITQSIIAIGNGGLFGKGYLNGTQAQLNFLPARHTDFIFALFAEEWGFIGAITIICLYLLFFIRCLSFLGESKLADSNLIIIGATTVISLHTIINIAMVTRILPVVGVPLPFFSYGGSALINMLFGVGLILSVRSRKFEEY